MSYVEATGDGLNWSWAVLPTERTMARRTRWNGTSLQQPDGQPE